MDIKPFLLAVLAGGLAAGTLDILYAFAWMLGFHGKSPLWVLQSVASGWMGKGAFTGGATAGVVGFLSHYGISLLWAAIYVLASRYVPALREHWIACGTLFGVFVYLAMNFAVIPLSAAPFKAPITLESFIRGFISHSALFGIPIAWCARAFDRVA